jgi:hypothetical protein
MSARHEQRITEMDPRRVEIRFSDGVLQAFGDLAAAVHFSEHISPETHSTLQDWATGKIQSVQDILVGFPSIAEEIFQHIHATGDKRAAEAWSNIGIEMLERGFTLARDHKKLR